MASLLPLALCFTACSVAICGTSQKQRAEADKEAALKQLREAHRAELTEVHSFLDSGSFRLHLASPPVRAGGIAGAAARAEMDQPQRVSQHQGCPVAV